MVTIKDGCGCDPCDCDWKQKLKEAYSRAIQSVNKIGDETGHVYYPDGTGFVKIPLPTKEQIDSLAQVDTIKASVDELNKTVPALETQVTGVTESLVSDVKVLNGTTAGKFKVRIEREKAAIIDSNDYDLSKVNSIELIQGSGPAMVKAQLTLSDGTVLRSDDFLFTTESIGTDVYISSFTFKAGNVDGTISADIGLNNGTTLEANNFVVPTDPSVVSTITDLQTRMSAVENSSGVTGFDALKATVDTHTTEITQLTNDVGGLMTSKVDVAQGTENAGKALVVGSDGNVAPGEISSGEVWEELTLTNLPTDWVVGDRVKIQFKIKTSASSTSPTTRPDPPEINGNANHVSAILEFSIENSSDGYMLTGTPIKTTAPSDTGVMTIVYIAQINDVSSWNSKILLTLAAYSFNTAGYNTSAVAIRGDVYDGVSPYVYKMWRLKK